MSNLRPRRLTVSRKPKPKNSLKDYKGILAGIAATALAHSIYLRILAASVPTQAVSEAPVIQTAEMTEDDSVTEDSNLNDGTEATETAENSPEYVIPTFDLKMLLDYSIYERTPATLVAFQKVLEINGGVENANFTLEDYQSVLRAMYLADPENFMSNLRLDTFFLIYESLIGEFDNNRLYRNIVRMVEEIDSYSGLTYEELVAELLKDTINYNPESDTLTKFLETGSANCKAKFRFLYIILQHYTGYQYYSYHLNAAEYVDQELRPKLIGHIILGVLASDGQIYTVDETEQANIIGLPQIYTAESEILSRIGLTSTPLQEGQNPEGLTPLTGNDNTENIDMDSNGFYIADENYRPPAIETLGISEGIDTIFEIYRNHPELIDTPTNRLHFNNLQPGQSLVTGFTTQELVQNLTIPEQIGEFLAQNVSVLNYRYISYLKSLSDEEFSRYLDTLNFDDVKRIINKLYEVSEQLITTPAYQNFVIRTYRYLMQKNDTTFSNSGLRTIVNDQVKQEIIDYVVQHLTNPENQPNEITAALLYKEEISQAQRAALLERYPYLRLTDSETSNQEIDSYQSEFNNLDLDTQSVIFVLSNNEYFLRGILEQHPDVITNYLSTPHILNTDNQSVLLLSAQRFFEETGRLQINRLINLTSTSLRTLFEFEDIQPRDIIEIYLHTNTDQDLKINIARIYQEFKDYKVFTSRLFHNHPDIVPSEIGIEAVYYSSNFTSDNNYPPNIPDLQRYTENLNAGNSDLYFSISDRGFQLTQEMADVTFEYVSGLSDQAYKDLIFADLIISGSARFTPRQLFQIVYTARNPETTNLALRELIPDDTYNQSIESHIRRVISSNPN